MLLILLVVTGSHCLAAQPVAQQKNRVSYEKVLNDAKHYWSFDISGNLFWISDKKTGVASKAKGNGARLIQAGNVRGVNFLRLKGYESRLQLGHFSDCSTATGSCQGHVTISLWLRFRDIGKKGQYFLGNTDEVTRGRGYSLTRTEAGMMNFSVVLPSEKVHALYQINVNEWAHHVLVLHMGGDIDVYLNSVKAMRSDVKREGAGRMDERRLSRRAITEGPSLSGLLSLGREGYQIDADFDEVAIWDRDLSDTEVKSLYKGSLSAPNIDKQCRTNASAICISWPALNDPYQQIMHVFVYYKVYTINQKRFSQMIIQKDKSSACIGLLEPLTNYTMGLYIRLRNTESLISRMTICETADGIPAAPANLKSNGVTSESIEVQWTTPKPQNGKITQYQVTLTRASDKKIEAQYRVEPQGEMETYNLNFTRLKPSTKYVIAIRSVGKQGQSGKVDIAIGTLSPVPQQTVTRFAAAQVSWNEVQLKWEHLPEFSKHQYIYEVLFKQGDGRTQVFQTTHDFLSVKNLRQLTSYLFNLRAGTKVGFGPSLSQDLYVRTPDRNECADNWANLCDINAKCFNTEGSYLCQCKNGYYGNGVTCRVLPADVKLDYFCKPGVDRNVFWPRTYQGDTAVQPCPNGTRGFATRYCLLSLNNHEAAFASPDLSACVSAEVDRIAELVDNPNVPAMVVVQKMKNVTDKNAVKYGGDIKSMVNIFDVVLDKKLNKSEIPRHAARDMTKDVVAVANDLLSDELMQGWKDIPSYPEDSRTKSASSLMDTIDGFASLVSVSIRGSEAYRVSLNNIEMVIQGVPQAEIDNAVQYSRADLDDTDVVKSISLNLGSLKNQKGKSNFSVSFLSVNNVENLLQPSRNRSRGSETRTSRLVVNSAVISASINGVDHAQFGEPVVIVLPHIKEERSVLNTSCVFWAESSEGGGDWLSDGCRVNFTNSSHTICHCDHLTNFAVLMSVNGSPAKPMSRGHQLALRIITYLGLLVSLVALFLALVAFTCFSMSAHQTGNNERFLKSARTIYHRHLILALIFAHVLFLVGIERTENKLACTLIAVFLHYFFLVAFVWMAMEGVLLYFMLTKIFNSRKLVKRKIFFLLCWALPGVYVAVLASVFTPYYGTGDLGADVPTWAALCWLSAKDGFSWSFVAPVLVVISMNLGFMVRAFRVMAEKRKGPDDLAHETWYWMKGCFVLTCVLGVTWIVGIFYVDSNTLVFAYIFNLLNAFQGLFIFIFHCIIDSRVRSEFFRILKCQTRSDYNEKAGYSSSMRFRYWSSTTKSSGSLDRSTISKGGHKRLHSDSLPDNNSRTDSCGRHPSLLKAVPEVEEDKIKRNGHITEVEAEPLLRAMPEHDFETTSIHSKPHSSMSDGDVFLDDIEVPSKKEDAITVEFGRVSPIDNEVARKISETSDATLDEIAEILEGGSPNTDADLETYCENDRQSPYDKIERSMEALVVSLEQEQDKIDSSSSGDEDRPGLLVEVDASSTQSSLSAEISLSDEEEEEDIGEENQLERDENQVLPCDCESGPKDNLTLGTPNLLNDRLSPNCDCSVQPNNKELPLDCSDERLHPVLTSNTVPTDEEGEHTPLLRELPVKENPEHAPCRPEEPDNASSLSPEDLQLVFAQVEQTPLFVVATYAPVIDRPLKSVVGKGPRQPTFSDSDRAEEFLKPEIGQLSRVE